MKWKRASKGRDNQSDVLAMLIADGRRRHQLSQPVCAHRPISPLMVITLRGLSGRYRPNVNHQTGSGSYYVMTVVEADDQTVRHLGT